MPEINNTFVRGKMNQDLDERLVPSGEYRDAINLEISTSEGSNVGSLQNILGNEKKVNKFVDPQTTFVSTWTAGGIGSLTNPVVVGSFVDNTNDNIYWFIASDNVSAIAEFVQSSQVLRPILVDTQNILNFSEDYLITGINVIEGNLYWTDDQTEPKTINIATWRGYNTQSNSFPEDFGTHTQLSGRNFEEADITVIKKQPLSPPTLTLLDTFRPGSLNTFSFNRNFGVADGAGGWVPVAPGDTFPLFTNDNILGFKIGDNIEAIHTTETETEKFTFVTKFQVKNLPFYDAANTRYEVECVMNSFDLDGEEISNDVLVYEASLVEPDGIFKLDFVRFAYRYKFENNQYSPLGPFSEVAFKPTGQYEWDSSKGFNSSMENSVKTIELSDIELINNVKEVEILYKNDSSNVIYSVDTVEKSDIVSGYKYVIDTELIYAVIDSNQILRPWDNVPRLAKSQELISNRIVYGNYLQNFNVKKSQEAITSSFLSTDPPTDELRPTSTVKSARSYQAGIVYMDKYGRQSPVFSSTDSATEIGKEYSFAKNSLQARGPAVANAPDWATHFKYFVKDASGGYYNLAMDRYYIAEDGNFWLSFPSADRNKVTEQSFLELKKEHTTDEAVLNKAKFKVLDIANEAPNFIKERTYKIGQITDQDVFDDNSYPAASFLYIDVKKSAWDASSAKGLESRSGLYVKVVGGAKNTELIKVVNIALFDTNYRLSLGSKLPIDIEDTVGTEGDKKPGIGLSIFTKEIENKPEFTGRFFVKLDSQDIARTHIVQEIDDALASNYDVVAGVSNMLRLKVDDGDNYYTTWQHRVTKGRWQADESYAYQILSGKKVTSLAEAVRSLLIPSSTPQTGFGVKAGQREISITYHGQRPGSLGNGETKAESVFVNSLRTPGTKISFTGIGAEADQVVYTILESNSVSIRNYDKRGEVKSDKNWYSNKRSRIDLLLDIPISLGVTDTNFPLTTNNFQSVNSFGLNILSDFESETTFSSSNPAIFETEPVEQADLDIYFEASKAFPISELNNLKTLDYYNAFSFGNGVESNRIRDDFNAPTIAKGVKASATLSEPYQEDRLSTGLIYSGIFNSTSGTNELNQFIQALPITKNLDPVYSSIQKLHARDTNLVVFCEDKVLRVYADKDALFNADGNTNLVSTNRVLGNADAFAGEFGISKNPESFASYGFRAYFTDSNRGVVCRLSNNGIEVISDYGMVDFFADNLSSSSNIVGSFDDDKSSYNVSVRNLTSEWQNKFKGFSKLYGSSNWTEYTPNDTVLSFKEKTNGWESRKSFSKHGGVSLNDVYYTFKGGEIWEHNIETVDRGKFYGVHFDSAVKFVANDLPASAKKFKALNYTGSNSKEYRYQLNAQSSKLSIAQVIASNITPTIETVHKEGWYAKNLTTDLQSGFIKEFANKENKFFQKITGTKTYFNSSTDTNIDSREISVQGLGSAYAIGGDYITNTDISFFMDSTCFTIIS